MVVSAKGRSQNILHTYQQYFEGSQDSADCHRLGPLDETERLHASAPPTGAAHESQQRVQSTIHLAECEYVVFFFAVTHIPNGADSRDLAGAVSNMVAAI